MATSIQCNNKPARDEDSNARHRNDKLAFGFAGGGGHTTTITLDSSGGAGNTQLVRPQSGHNHLQLQQIQVDRPTLVDLLIDSQCDWRQLIGEANGPRETLAQHLSEMQIKRQEIIHELIQTERHHCLTLALMRQVYLAGLLQLNESRQRNSTSGQHQYVHEATSNTQRSPPGEPIDIERLFPALEELIQAHELFFAHLRLRLVECCQSPSRPYKPLVGIIGSLGDLLIEQFKVTPTDQGEHSSTNQEVTSTRCRRHKPKCHAHSPMDTHKHTKRQHKSLTQQQERTNTNGYKLLQAYAKFCGQHYESSRYYKQLLQFDKGFKQFIEQCNKQHAACRQRGIPECNLLVAQRLTKYPLLIEQLIKASKDEPNDEEEKLRRALGECRALLAELNSQLARKESFERLLDIYAQFSPKSHTIFYHKSALRFTKHDLLQHRRLRQLVHSDDQVRIWSATRRKLFPILCLILNDIIVFLRVDQQQQEQQLGSSSQQVVAAVVSAQLAAAAAAHQLDHEAEAHDGRHEMATAATQSPSAGTNPNQQQQQQPPATTTTTTTPAPSVRYYFANIDNKSSVISLSKLLVREKAVEEAEPRVYLISSSPKQPEMYELAFISRRHQTTFCDKLKTAIEVHTRAKLLPDSTAHYLRNTRLQNWTSRDGQLDGNPFITGGQQVDQVESSGSSECCSLASCSSSSSSSSSCGSSSSSLAGGSVGPATGSESQASDVDADDDEEHQRGETTLSTSGNGEPAMTSQQVSPTKTTTTTTSNCKRVDLELENLELDIEQDLVPAPSCLDLTTCCDIDGRPSDRHAHEQTDAAREILARTESATPLSGGLPEIGPLSERARDSCDDLSSPRLLLGHGCRRQKARGNRKRRFQRPRQVSNQSTDSGATSGTSLTSGLGSGECLEFGAPSHQSSAKSPPVHQGGGASEQPDSTCGRGAGREEEDLDSGRGRDDCSSSSSSSSHDSMTTGGGSTSATCQPNHPSETNELVAAQSSSSSPKSSISSEVGELISPQVAATTTIQTGSQGPVSPPSAGGGHKQHLLNQRKLSTVSNLSSQMKLLQKLRSVGLLATTGSGGHTSDPYGAAAHNHQQAAQPLSLCANCIYQQHYKDALDDTTGTMSKRHLQQQQHLRQLSKRRSLFVPEQKLEELRNLRIQLDKDKQEWQEKFDRMQEQLLNERRDLDLARERLKIDRTQIENEREQLYRKLEILKENGILLSPSHKVIITSPDQCARLMSGGQHQASQRLQHPPVYISNQTVMMQQQQAAHLMASARVPMHLSQQQHQHQQQMVGAQQAQQHYSGSIRSSGGGGLMSVLPGASFLVKRFGGGGGAGGTNQPINGKLSQSTLTISQHNHLQQQNHFANQSNHVLL